MSKFLKYILLSWLLIIICQPVSAWQKKGTNKKTTHSKNQKKKVVKKSKKKNTKNTIKLIIPKSIPVEEIVKQLPIDIPVLRDTVPAKVVSILSAFKPQLKSVVKINFTNASPIIDTQVIHYDYQIPGQNLSFSYQPITLNPLAIVLVPPSPLIGNTNVKVGFGNYLYQLLNINLVNIRPSGIHHVSISTESSEGVHHLQKYRNSYMSYQGNFKINDSNSFITNFLINQRQSYRYGLVPDTLSLPTINYLQKFTDVGFKMAFLSKKKLQSNILFKPTLDLSHLWDVNHLTNTYLSFVSPISYILNSEMKLQLNMDFSYSKLMHFTPSSNTLLRFDPAIHFTKWNVKSLIGVSPVLTNNGFKLYPNIQLNHVLTDSTWSIHVGWTSHSNNTSFKQLLNENPWISIPWNLKIMSHEKQYVKFKVNASKNLQYEFGISLNKMENLPLFNKEPISIASLLPGNIPNNNFYNNRVVNGLPFMTIFESKAHTIQLEADLNYQFSDLFSLKNHFSYTSFTYLKDNEKPWGFAPLQFKADIFWRASNRLLIDGSFNFLSGIASSSESAYYIARTLPPMALLNAGLTYSLSKPWKIWVQSKNLLNSQYQRWAEYPELGVQINAGVVYSFHK